MVAKRVGAQIQRRHPRLRGGLGGFGGSGEGLHEFLTGFIARNNQITDALSADYNFG